MLISLAFMNKDSTKIATVVRFNSQWQLTRNTYRPWAVERFGSKMRQMSTSLQYLDSYNKAVGMASKWCKEKK